MAIVDNLNRAFRRVPIWALYAMGAVPPVWFFFLGVTGQSGPEPIRALEHDLGELALQALILGLAISPLRRLAGLNLIRFRRAIGVLAFFYVAAHFLTWLVLDVGILSQIWADIVKRPYITIGVAGFALLLPLALTSNDYSVRKLGPGWRKLHKLVYPAVILSAVHNIMVQKVWEAEALIYMGVIAVLLAWRVWESVRKISLISRRTA